MSFLSRLMRRQPPPDPATAATPASLFDALCRCLREEDLCFVRCEDTRYAVRLPFDSDGLRWVTYAQVGDTRPYLMFLSVLDVEVPETHRIGLALEVTRLNHDLVLGNWEVGLENGDLRYRTAIDLSNAPPSVAVCRNALRANLAIIDRDAARLQAGYRSLFAVGEDMTAGPPEARLH